MESKPSKKGSQTVSHERGLHPACMDHADHTLMHPACMGGPNRGTQPNNLHLDSMLGLHIIFESL